MSEAALLRPGIATGSYPEREDVRESWLDRTTSAVFGALYQRFGPNHLDRGFLRQVARASEGLELLTTHKLSEMASCSASRSAPQWSAARSGSQRLRGDP